MKFSIKVMGLSVKLVVSILSFFITKESHLKHPRESNQPVSVA